VTETCDQNWISIRSPWPVSGLIKLQQLQQKTFTLNVFGVNFQIWINHISLKPSQQSKTPEVHLFSEHLTYAWACSGDLNLKIKYLDFETFKTRIFMTLNKNDLRFIELFLGHCQISDIDLAKYYNYTV